MKQQKEQLACRLGKVGGEAVIEGVMMKSGDLCATACRKEDGSIIVSKQRFVSIRKKKKLLNIPILRGIVNFIEMMRLSMRSLNVAADALGINDEEEGRFEKWLKKHFGVRATDLLMGFATVSVTGCILQMSKTAPTGMDLLVSASCLGAEACAVMMFSKRKELEMVPVGNPEKRQIERKDEPETPWRFSMDNKVSMRSLYSHIFRVDPLNKNSNRRK